MPGINSAPVTIVGAGPVGLFAAILLTRAGHRVLVLEKNDGLAMDMRASTFHPATLDLLHEAGLAEPLIFRGSIGQGWQYMIHGTKQHAVFDLAIISDATAHPFRLLCEQFHLSNIAVEQLVRNPLFEIRFGQEVLQTKNLPDGVALTVRSSGGEKTINSQWLIAADGGQSAVRQQLGLGFEGESLPKASITVVLNHSFQNDIPGLLGINYVWTETGHYGLTQIRDLWRFSYSPHPDQGVEEALSEAAVQDRIQSVFPHQKPYELLQINHYSLNQRCLASFRHGRVLFAGDSAHLESPAGGMGMNAGLHDAHCLAEHLVPVLEGASDQLLDRYSRRRRTIALEETQRLSSRNYYWHRETRPGERQAIWQGLQDILSSEEKTRDFLLESSMVHSRQREKEIE
ncbi:FAD-dependent oxidoreductase [Pseudomonadota bacterium]